MRTPGRVSDAHARQCARPPASSTLPALSRRVALGLLAGSSPLAADLHAASAAALAAPPVKGLPKVTDRIYLDIHVVQRYDVEVRGRLIGPRLLGLAS